MGTGTGTTELCVKRHNSRDWTSTVTYRAYSGPRGSEIIAPLEKDRLLYKEFDTLDDALTWARHLNQGDRVALLIEGDDGTRLGKREIASALVTARPRHAERR